MGGAVVVASAADDITQQNYKYVFRVNPSSAYYASGLMSYLGQVVKPQTMAILYESSDFGTSGADEMAKAPKEMQEQLQKNRFFLYGTRG